jgi:hypothetical protein
VSPAVGRVRRTNGDERACHLREQEADAGEYEVTSEEREAGGGMCGEREAGERDEHAPLIGS